jgi:hypothetical protein
MKTLKVLFLGILLLPIISVAQGTYEFSFDNYKKGELPKDWFQFFNGKGTHTDWKIVNEGTNLVMAQLSADNPNLHFNVVINKKIVVKDAEISVRLKALRGKYDQGGGIVWRMQDKNNYYVVRYNPLEDNIVLYKMQEGIRSDLPLVGKGRTYGTTVKADGHKWNTLTVKIQGNLFTVYFNGKEMFKVKDDTFKSAGKIGLWTKADAVTYFDDLKIKNYNHNLKKQKP